MDLTHFFLTGGLTLICTSLTAVFYYRNFYKRDITFAIVVFGSLVYCIVTFVSFEDGISLGLGIGLLGILSMIRLRSSLDNLIDIGFVFYSITIGLVNAATPTNDLLLLLGTNILLFGIISLLSSKILMPQKLLKTRLTFDDLGLEMFHDKENLRSIVSKKYSMDVVDVVVEEINYLRDSVTVIVYYHSQ